MGTLRQQMINASVENLADVVQDVAYDLTTTADLDPLMEKIVDANYVLLGEASHGILDYYTWRIRLSRRLIKEKGFSFTAVEGDWPDCYRLNRFVKGNTVAESAYAVLHAFRRWPTWMRANWEIVVLAEWLRDYNQSFASAAGNGRSPTEQVGFYGLDVYSLHESLAVITDYLTENEPQALPAAQEAYRCFDPYGVDGQTYAWRNALLPLHLEPVTTKPPETYPWGV